MKFADLPKTYEELVKIEMPRVIGGKKHFDRALKMAMAMAGFKLTKAQCDYFETLAILIESWESKHCKIIK